ncbi:uncharacterized protein BDW70DRAFT_129342 [Aspergillus foveolatus]|uniref:uncharacterized protein n=1 Tax=Aspergillus foveolatus TaxID=210207 RepID=UPI003CCE0A3C
MAGSPNRGMPAILDLISSDPKRICPTLGTVVSGPRCQNLLLLHQTGIFFKLQDKIAEIAEIEVANQGDRPNTVESVEPTDGGFGERLLCHMAALILSSLKRASNKTRSDGPQQGGLDGGSHPRSRLLKQVCAFSAFIEKDCHAVPCYWVEMLIMFAKPP